MIWRSIYDCHRNAVQAYTFKNYNHKIVKNKNNKEMIDMLKEKGIDWDKVPTAHKHGVYGKRSLYTKLNDDGSTCVRSMIVNMTFRIKCTKDFEDFLLSKDCNKKVDADINFI